MLGFEFGGFNTKKIDYANSIMWHNQRTCTISFGNGIDFHFNLITIDELKLFFSYFEEQSSECKIDDNFSEKCQFGSKKKRKKLNIMYICNIIQKTKSRNWKKKNRKSINLIPNSNHTFGIIFWFKFHLLIFHNSIEKFWKFNLPKEF